MATPTFVLANPRSWFGVQPVFGPGYVPRQLTEAPLPVPTHTTGPDVSPVVVDAGTDQTIVVSGAPMRITRTGGLAPAGPIVPHTGVGEFNPQGVNDRYSMFAAYEAQQASLASNAYANQTDTAANVIAPMTSINWGGIFFWIVVAVVGWTLLRHFMKGGHR